MKLAAFGALLLLATACIGTTGSELVTFRAVGRSALDVQDHTLTFETGQKWNVTLTKANVHVGALYLNRSVPVSGGQERSCFLPGVYVAQVLDGADIDALSSAPQPFPYAGDGTADRAVTGEVWLTHGRIDALDDPRTIAEVEGTAARGGVQMRFEGRITIGRNRANRSTDPAHPGKNPLCGERIVSQIRTDITPTDGGTLVLRIDPRAWFDNVDFGTLPVLPDTELRRFSDDESDQASTNLYRGLRASGRVYSFGWEP